MESNRSRRLAKAHKFSIRHDESILAAIKKMDEVERKLLLVLKDGRYLGLLSIGDVQRKLLSSFDLKTDVQSAMRPSQRVAQAGDSVDFIGSRILELRAEMMPVIDENNSLVDIYLWEDFYADVTRARPTDALAGTPVVIMAGGQGTRLKPITNVIPKALVPIGDKPIIEEIIHRFHAVGASQFFISLNYKGDVIQHYFSGRPSQKFTLEYFHETTPLGTVGALKMLQDRLKRTFFVSNCDILVEQDYSAVFKYHQENKNQITVVGVMKNIAIPYGTIEVDDGGILRSMQEKPEFNLIFNSGMYLMEPSILDLIPEGSRFDAPDLIKLAQRSGMRVGVFPVNEKSWHDIGEWSSYIERVALSNLREGR